MNRNLELKVGALIIATLFLGLAFLAYIMTAKGAFQRVYTITLITRNADGIAVGMPIVFAGVNIGYVGDMELADNGDIRLGASIQSRYAKWVRQNSLFLLEQPLIGNGKIKVTAGKGDSREIRDHEERPLFGAADTMSVTPLMNKAYTVLDNFDRLTRPQGKIEQLFTDADTVSRSMSGKYGIAGGLLGSDEKARKLTDAITQLQTLLTRLQGISTRTDSILAKTDQQVFGEQGTANDVRKLLQESSTAMERLDAVLKNSEVVTANFRQGSNDMAELRSQIDESLRKTNQMLGELNKKWPFAKEKPSELP